MLKQCTMLNVMLNAQRDVQRASLPFGDALVIVHGHWTFIEH